MYAHTQAHSRSQLLVIFFRQPEMEHSGACEQRCINQPRRVRVILWCTGWLCTRSFVVCKKMTGLFGPFSYARVLHALFTLRRVSSGVKSFPGYSYETVRQYSKCEPSCSGLNIAKMEKCMIDGAIKRL